MLDTLRYRQARLEDSPLLATLNQALIRDEGHRNAMMLPELEARMRGWLAGEYVAILFEAEERVCGYCLFRSEPEFVYLRQFYIVPERRRQGAGRAAISWLCAHLWRDAPRIRLDVLCDNPTGRAFWEAVGFQPYCLTMEFEPGRQEPPPQDDAPPTASA